MKTIKKHWFEFLLISSVLFTLFSCDIQKKAIKQKEDRTVSEVSEKTIFRKGDTVTYVIPKIIRKDTTIYTVNRQGTTLKTVYDNSGNVSQIDCYSSLIEISERNEKLLQEVIKSKDSEKEEKFDSDIILYLFGAIVLIVLIIAFFFFKYMKTQTSGITEILNHISK